MPFVGEFLMSTPKGSRGEPGVDRFSGEPLLSDYPLQGVGLSVPVQVAAGRSETGRVSMQCALFSFVWRLASPSPGTLFPEAKLLLLPVGTEAAAQGGGVMEGTRGPRAVSVLNQLSLSLF